ncbi:hypothetical protein CRM22_008137 [Opisthorchis felineus]|uniref:Protein VAC14 homolog n=1 Tax=Opisthorchis felineus TaxID=147828 RepID=A0A4S2LD64_OPIFE|nr:hypothetical protein CRM22_008137 [Opisthorchis felineus]
MNHEFEHIYRKGSTLTCADSVLFDHSLCIHLSIRDLVWTISLVGHLPLLLTEMDRGYPPLTSSCVKNLVDKLFEKRKLAATEIERITKESFTSEKRGDVVKLIGYFTQDFITSHNPHTRKGGLLGLASVVIGLNQNAAMYYKSIFPPVLRTIHDNDPRVRYYACETLYNVMKITRKETLDLLSEVFDAISRGVSDPDLSVRQGAVQCDRLLKEIVTEPDFVSYSVIVSLLRERIYTNNPHTRQFIVSWTSTLHAIPGLKISTYLPQLLDGLFRILGDPNPDIRRQCELLLDDLLREIFANPTRIAFDAMINTLIVHCRLSATAFAMNEGGLRSGSPPESSTNNVSAAAAIVMDTSNQSACLMQNASSSGTVNSSVSSGAEQLQQRTALTWIRAFVELDAVHLLPYASGIIGAVLPCFLLYNTAETVRDRRGTLETAVRINETLMNFVNTFKPTNVNETSTPNEGRRLEKKEPSFVKPKPTAEAVSANRDLTQPSQLPLISTDAILDASCRLLDHPALLTRLAALGWIEVLAKVRAKDVLCHVVHFLPLMLNLLADPAAEMVHSAISLIGNLCSNPDAMELLDEQTLDAIGVSEELLRMLVPPSHQTPQPTCRLFRAPKVQYGVAMTPSMDEGTVTEMDSCNIFCVRFLLELVWFFDKNTTLLTQRGDMIITDLCHVLGADVVYRNISAIISYTKELPSAFVLVDTLNRILLTQPGLHDFRNQLRAIHTEDGCHLLDRLYRAWCHNPVALLSLYMLTQNYQQCNRLIKSFGEINMTVETLVEMDQLIQMIESPIFATLRMHLLDKRYSAELRETLYCLLMCLPQTDAFQTLWRRLQCIPPVASLSDWPVVSGHSQPDFKLINSYIQFDALFDYFNEVQRNPVSRQLPQTLETEKSSLERTAQLVDLSLPPSGDRLTDSRTLYTAQTTEDLKGKSSTVASATEYLAQNLEKTSFKRPRNMTRER